MDFLSIPPLVYGLDPPPKKQYELLIDTLASFFEAFLKLSSQFIAIAWKNMVAERVQRASTSEDTRK